MAYHLIYRLGYATAGFVPGQASVISDKEYASLRKQEAVQRLIERGYLKARYLPSVAPAPPLPESIGEMRAKDAVRIVTELARNGATAEELGEAKDQELSRAGKPRETVLRVIDGALEGIDG